MTQKKYLSECHHVEAVYFACEDWGAFLCTKCGEKCKADEVGAAIECGTLVHASDGSTCANIKPCFLHDREENKKLREKVDLMIYQARDEKEIASFEGKVDDIERIVDWRDEIKYIMLGELKDKSSPAAQKALAKILKIFEAHGKAEREKGGREGYERGKELRGKEWKEDIKEIEQRGYTKGIEDSIAVVKEISYKGQYGGERDGKEVYGKLGATFLITPEAINALEALKK